MAVAIPVQLSATIRGRHLRLHRWLGRMLVGIGVLVGVTGYAMALAPVGGLLAVSAIVFYATAFMVSLIVAWLHIRHGDVARHREWMPRAVGIVLGVATTRPIVAAFFASSRLTHLTLPQYFGAAMWIGFSATAVAAEIYIRLTRSRPSRAVADRPGMLRAV